jgi:hypothetical protein
MNVALGDDCEKPLPIAPEDESPGGTFVSSTLATWKTANPERFVRDFQINDTIYRRLDPEYYAWLRSRMVLAKKAAKAGHLDGAAFEDMRIRFNAVHDWAVEHFGEEQLLTAVRTLRAGEYSPPVVDDKSKCSLPPMLRSAGNHVSPEATALVDTISERALALGWSRQRLFTTGTGVFDPRRGLVCYLKPGDRIGEVTAQSIEIIRPSPSEVRHRFYNPDVDQPWERRNQNASDFS